MSPPTLALTQMETKILQQIIIEKIRKIFRLIYSKFVCIALPAGNCRRGGREEEIRDMHDKLIQTKNAK
jgi:hypothetical protein